MRRLTRYFLFLRVYLDLVAACFSIVVVAEKSVYTTTCGVV